VFLTSVVPQPKPLPLALITSTDQVPKTVVSCKALPTQQLASVAALIRQIGLVLSTASRPINNKHKGVDQAKVLRSAVRTTFKAQRLQQPMAVDQQQPQRSALVLTRTLAAKSTQLPQPVARMVPPQKTNKLCQRRARKRPVQGTDSLGRHRPVYKVSMKENTHASTVLRYDQKLWETELCLAYIINIEV